MSDEIVKDLVTFVKDILELKRDYYSRLSKLYKRHGSKVLNVKHPTLLLNVLEGYSKDIPNDVFGAIVKAILKLYKVELDLDFRRISYGEGAKVLNEAVEELYELLRSL